jgi:hypothetical protein
VGLHLDVASLEVTVDYSISDRVVDLKACLLQPPDTVAAGGRAFGILPLWLTVRLDPRDDEIRIDDFMNIKAKLSQAAREVHENTQTEVLLERN